MIDNVDEPQPRFRTVGLVDGVRPNGAVFILEEEASPLLAADIRCEKPISTVRAGHRRVAAEHLCRWTAALLRQETAGAAGDRDEVRCAQQRPKPESKTHGELRTDEIPRLETEARDSLRLVLHQRSVGDLTERHGSEGR